MSKYLNVWRIVGIYFLFSFLWILFSDAVLEFFIDDIQLLNTWQTYKGLLFISTTSVLLFFLIRFYVKELKNAQKNLKSSKQRLDYVIEGANLGYWDWDCKSDKQIVNSIWLSMLGLEEDEIKQDITDWADRIHPDDLAAAKEAIKQTHKDDKPYTIEFRMRHKDGHWVWIEGSGAVVQRDSKTKEPLRLAGTHKDITIRKLAEKKISFLALNDSLTKLPNRAALKKELGKLLTQKRDESFAFLFLDLDYFKNINDMYGHSQGDRIIKKVARRLNNCLNKDDFIARVGGDEFVILKKNIKNLENECDALIHALDEPFFIENEPNTMGLSLGIALYPKDGTTFEELFKKADTAMYEAKNSGKNRYCFYTSSMTDVLLSSTRLDNELKKAIENEDFVVHFQPQIDLKTLKVIGVEALVRWQKTASELVFPDGFISKAEKNGYIVDISKIVMKKSIKEFKQWINGGLFEGILAINISAVQLEEENFVKDIQAICEQMDISASLIELEITESYIMQNPYRSIEKLKILQELGFKISIDDFGTGYSSLSYLKKLPVNKLKIDKSFISDLPSDEEDKAITKTIIALAQNLEIEVLAEGVETKEQEIFLQANGCDSVQGYFYTKPVDEKNLTRYLSSL